MAIVTRFLRKLLCCCLLCFIFCGVFPGFVYADDGIFHYFPGVTFFSGSNSIHIDPEGVGSLGNQFEGIFPGSYVLVFRDSFPKEFDSLRIDDISVNISHSGLELPDLSFSYPFNYQVAVFENYNNYVYSASPLSCYFAGSATVTFSDGSTSTIPLFSHNSISFSAKKVNSSNQFLISSEDFNLSANPDDKNSGLTFKSRSDNAQNIPTDELFLSNVIVKGARIENARSSGLNNSFSASGDFNYITIPQNVIRGTANLTTGAISATASGRVGLSLGNFSLSLAIMYVDRLILPEISSTTAGVSVKNAEFEIAGKAVIDEAPVTIVPASENVYITGFSVTGTINFKIVDYSSISSNSSLPFFSCLLFLYNPVYTFGTSENLLAHIAGTLDGIYFTFRYDLPLQLRHLLIPTQEEVKDVLEESFDNIAEEYPSAAGTITTIKGQFADFNAAISGSSTRGLVLPGITVSIPGSDRKVKLWEDFDLLPYLQTGPARSLMYWVELMLKALIFIYLVRQAASMFISAITGYSYLEWFGLSNKPFMGDDGLGEALPEGYLEREVG